MNIDAAAIPPKNLVKGTKYRIKRSIGLVPVIYDGSDSEPGYEDYPLKFLYMEEGNRPVRYKPAEQGNGIIRRGAHHPTYVVPYEQTLRGIALQQINPGHLDSSAYYRGVVGGPDAQFGNFNDLEIGRRIAENVKREVTSGKPTEVPLHGGRSRKRKTRRRKTRRRKTRRRR
jgi:hypothetical protein